jgi:hypothetical protein
LGLVVPEVVQGLKLAHRVSLAVTVELVPVVVAWGITTVQQILMVAAVALALFYLCMRLVLKILAHNLLVKQD